MLGQHFSFGEIDEELEFWINENLGQEVFSPQEGRLDKFFSEFKSEFLKNKIPIITIAGTNGKGEVALLLEDLFLKNGLNPFVWSSPHTLSVRERFSGDGRPIDGSLLKSYFEKFDYLKKELSFYEFLFFCFNYWFSKEGSKLPKPVLIFEVGLGGRLDATNFFDADMAVLVSIGRDHMDILGPTLGHVLNEKFEIVREGSPLISAVSQNHLVNEIQKKSKEIGISLFQLDDSPGEEDFRARNRRLAALAFTVFGQERGINWKNLEMAEVTWARPFKVTYKTTQFILLGSHNLDGLRHLAYWVNEENKRLNLSCSNFDEAWIGMSRRPGKDLDQCLRLLSESPCLGQELVFFGFDHPRATPLNEIEMSFNGLDQGRKVRFEKSWQHYLEQDHSHKKILVCGSYYFVGELLRKSSLKQHFHFH